MCLCVDLCLCLCFFGDIGVIDLLENSNMRIKCDGIQSCANGYINGYTAKSVIAMCNGMEEFAYIFFFTKLYRHKPNEYKRSIFMPKNDR